MKQLLSLSTLYPNPANPRFGTFVARSLEALAARGDWEVTMINPMGVPPIAFGKYRAIRDAAIDGQEHGVRVLRPVFPLIPKIGGRINPALIARAVWPLVRQLHESHHFDVMDAQFFYPDGPAVAALAARLNVPFSIKARGADIHYWGGQGGACKQMRSAASKADGLLAVCGALADDMAALGLPRDKITLHYTGLDRIRFSPADRAEARKNLRAALDIPLPENAPVLASVGALIPRKGQEFVIGALPEIPNAHLLLVGKGEDEARLKLLAHQSGGANRVHFLGLLDHNLLPLVLNAADAMVLPSSSEGLANAWVEALSCGTPLVITDAGGARELVTHRDAGLIVERNTPAIAQGIHTLLADPPPREKVAAMAARFSWEANADSLANYYETLIRT
ncbi:MAG: glycosyltransferase [Sphingomonadaceae bacterium]